MEGFDAEGPIVEFMVTKEKSGCCWAPNLLFGG